MRTERQRQRTAYHEAGHAVMRLQLGRRPTRASIKPRAADNSLGHVAHLGTKLDVDWIDPRDWRLQRWAETEIMVAMAGGEAERIYSGRCYHAGCAADSRRVSEIVLRTEGLNDRRQLAFVTWLREKTRDRLGNSLVWLRVEAVAAALMQRETLTGAEIRQVCEEPKSWSRGVQTEYKSGQETTR